MSETMKNVNIANNDVEERFTAGIIGAGQGGTSAACNFASYFNVPQDLLISCNLSSADLKGAKMVLPQNSLLLDKKGFGSGKDREYAKGKFIPKKDFVIEKISEIFNDRCNLIFVCFSMGGGSGSGIGPMLTSLLQSPMFKKPAGQPTLIYGIGMLPDSEEGELSQQNARKALAEIQAFSENKYARFFIMDNNVFGNIREDIDKWNAVNNLSAKFLKRYISDNYVGTRGNLDQNDRFTALSATGVHALASYELGEGGSIKVISPFVLPEGANVRYQASELPNGHAFVKKLIQTKVGAYVNDDTLVGYYDESESDSPLSESGKPFPMVHFAGFNNLGKVSERHENWFNRIQMKSEAATEVDTNKASFENISQDDHLIQESRTIKSASMEDILRICG